MGCIILGPGREQTSRWNGLLPLSVLRWPDPIRNRGPGGLCIHRCQLPRAWSRGGREHSAPGGTEWTLLAQGLMLRALSGLCTLAWRWFSAKRMSRQRDKRSCLLTAEQGGADPRTQGCGPGLRHTLPPQGTGTGKHLNCFLT